MPDEQKTPDSNPKPGSEKSLKESLPADKPTVKKIGPLNWIFNKETRLGKLNRSIVRTIGWVVALFALGFFAVYLLLFLPLSQQYDQMSIAYNNSLQQLKTAQVSSRATQDGSKPVQAVLDKTKMSNDILDINNQILQIELALAQHDQQGAVYLLKKLQTSFDTFIPEVNKLDPELSSLLDARIKVIGIEISNDPKAAQADLEILIKYLQDLVTLLSQSS
jgi:hypothetical protein